MGRPACGYGTLVATRTELEAARRRRRECRPWRPGPGCPHPGPHRITSAWRRGTSTRSRPARRRCAGSWNEPDPMSSCCRRPRRPTSARWRREVFDELGYGVVHAGSGAVQRRGRRRAPPDRRRRSVGRPRRRAPRTGTAPDRCTVDGPTPIRVASVYVPHGREVGHSHFEYKLGLPRRLRDRSGMGRGRALDRSAVTSTWPATDSDVFHPDAFVGLTHVTEPSDRLWPPCWSGAGRPRRVRWGRASAGSRGGAMAGTTNLGMRIDLLGSRRQLAELARDDVDRPRRARVPTALATTPPSSPTSTCGAAPTSRRPRTRARASGRRGARAMPTAGGDPGHDEPTRR